MEALPFPFRVTLVEPQPVFRDMNGKRSLGLAVKGFEFPAYAAEVPVSFNTVDFHVIFSFCYWLMGCSSAFLLSLIHI